MNSILSFFEALFFRIGNLFEVIPSQIQDFTMGQLVGSALWFFTFFFLSRWVKAYIFRLALLLLGVYLLWSVAAKSHIIDNVDFYVGLGLLIPQIEIVELSYLIAREKLFSGYYRSLSFLEVIARPFVWLYTKFNYFKDFNKAKQEGHSYSEFKQEQQNFDEEFKQRQWQEYQKEQARRDEQKRQTHQKQREEYKQNQEQTRQQGYSSEDEKERARQEYQEKVREQARKEEANKHPRWDSKNPYVVLDIHEGATFKEIKKKYHQLCQVYHPDLTMDMVKKEKLQEITKMLNRAYEKLK